MEFLQNYKIVQQGFYVRHFLLSLGFIALFLSINSCRLNINELPEGKASVVATTGMIGDLVMNIGGDSIDVTSLMGPGVDPHLYKATQGDLRRLQRADLIFYNGLHLEGKMGAVLEKLARIRRVRAITSDLNENLLLVLDQNADLHDPHIWFDVSLWSKTIDVVLKSLIEVKPNAKAYFEKNALDYKNNLVSLHQEVTQLISSIPKENRILITAHDAFSYFGKAYDIEVKGLQGISTLSEFGLKDRVDLINYIVDHRIKAVFVETSVAQKNIDAIVEGCQQKGHNVVIGGSLYSDAMGTMGTEEGTYEGMVRANVSTIVKALK